MALTLPFNTPSANVLRFILLEYIIVKLFAVVSESVAQISASNRAKAGGTVSFREGWLAFFLVPYRIQERSVLRKTGLWVVALAFNAFLLSVEFGFQSVTMSNIPIVAVEQQISTVELGASQALDGVDDINWITRASRIAQKCTNRKGLSVYAPEGFIRDVFLDDELAELENGEVVCADDSRLRQPLAKMMFNLSYSGVQDTKEPFRHAGLELVVETLSENMFSFYGGDVDMLVKGTLGLSQSEEPDSEPAVTKYSFDVSGACTGFTASDDARVYCYLSDGDLNRFIVPGLRAGEDVQPLSDVSAGEMLRLADSGPVFRATVLEYDDTWLARDGDQLAALKGLVGTFVPRSGAASEDPVVLRRYVGAVVECFYSAMVLGPTSVRRVKFGFEGGDQELTERAQVSVWAVALLAVVFGLLVVAAVGTWLAVRSRGGGAPVKYNKLAEMVTRGRDGVVTYGGGAVCKEDYACDDDTWDHEV